MAASAGAIGTGGIMAAIGAAVLLVGVGMFMSGPIVQAEHQQNSGFLGLGGSQSSSASFNALPVMGLVLVLVGAIVLLAGLKGVMAAFERGKERDEGTRHHLTVKRE